MPRPLSVLVASAALGLAVLVPMGAAQAANTCSVSVTGTSAVGETVTANRTNNGGGAEFPGTGWYVGSTPDAAASGSPVTMATTYEPTEADLGKYIQFRASYFDFSGPSTYFCVSAASQVTRLTVSVPGTPSASGKAKKNTTLTANVGSLPPGVSATYQWLRQKKHKAAKPIAGATAATYKLKGKDVGKKVSVQVTYSKVHQTSKVLTSAPRKVH